MSYWSYTRGMKPTTTVKAFLNKLTYAFVRVAGDPPPLGWVFSPRHWYRFPFPLRGEVLWSNPLGAWFYPEDEFAIEGMLKLQGYEPVDWFRPCPGDVFLDIGAFVGWYTIRAAQLVGPAGRVIALEPDPTNRRQLEKNLSLNQIRNCAVLPLAAWSKSGRVGWRPGEQPVWHRVTPAGGSAEIEATTVDELVGLLALQRVDWIKLDVEGAEVEVLKGAKETLRVFRPSLYIEVHETLGTLRGLLAQSGYTLLGSTFDVAPNRHGWILARFS